MVRLAHVRAVMVVFVAIVTALCFPTWAFAGAWSFSGSGSVVAVTRSVDDTSGSAPDLYVYSAYKGGAAPDSGFGLWDTSSYSSGGLYAAGSALCSGWVVPVSGVSLLRVSGDGVEARYVSVSPARLPVSVAGTVPVEVAPGASVSIVGSVPLSDRDRDTFDVVMAAAVLGCVGVFVLAGYRLSRGA